MPPTSSIRQLLTGRTLRIAALAGLLAPLGACDGGDAQQCEETRELGGVAVNGAGPFCPSHDPPDGGSPEVALEGVVRNVAGGTIVVDSCHPNDSCAPMESVITLSGTDLSVSIPDGTFVQLQVHSKGPYGTGGCLWHVSVRNLPTWGGSPNPTSDGTFLWLAHHYTYQDDYSLPDDPYQTQRELFCRNKPHRFDVSAFGFSFPDAPGATVLAPPGQTVTWSVPAGEHAGEYRVRTTEALSSTDTEPSDLYNYWIARK